MPFACKRGFSFPAIFLLLACLSVSAETFTDIHRMSGWTWCGACAGAGGNGPTVPYSITQGVLSPSMDGDSTQFWLGGNKPYSNAIWWKQLGGQNSATHFIYDAYFYLTDSAAPQALEFDVNQSVDGQRWIFGTECDIRGNHTWDVWDTASAHWVHTSIPCNVPPAYTWNHVTIELERVNGLAHFISITLNGNTGYVDKYFGSESGPASELNVAFQMDGNYQQKNYSVWLDKVSLTAW